MYRVKLDVSRLITLILRIKGRKEELNEGFIFLPWEMSSVKDWEKLSFRSWYRGGWINLALPDLDLSHDAESAFLPLMGYLRQGASEKVASWVWASQLQEFRRLTLWGCSGLFLWVEDSSWKLERIFQRKLILSSGTRSGVSALSSKRNSLTPL